MRDDPKLLNLMLEDLSKQKGIYQPGPYWSKYTERITQAIKLDGLVNFRANTRIGKGYADTSITDPLDLLPINHWKTRILKKSKQLPFVRKLIKRYDRLNRKNISRVQLYKSLYFTSILENWFAELSDTYDLPDTLVGNPQQRVTIGNQSMGEIYLRMFAWVHDYSRKIDFSKVHTMFEIGGGFGAFAHTILQFFPNIKKYLYLDIPPILYVGTQYLKHFFEKEVIDYRATRNLETIEFSSDDSRQILALCPWQIEKVDAAIDVFWNSSSLQEMPANVVSNYVKHIDRLVKGDRNTRICMFIYSGGKPEKTLMFEELNEIITRNISVECEQIETEIVNHVIDGYSLICKRL